MQQDCRSGSVCAQLSAGALQHLESRAVQNGRDLEANGGFDDVECIDLQLVRVLDDSHIAADHRVERVGAARSQCRVESAWSLGDGAARAVPRKGIEPGTSRTLSTNRTIKPNGQLVVLGCPV